MRNLMALAITLLMWGSINAQQIKFGAKAGTNFASFEGDNAEDSDSRSSFHLGVIAELGLSKNFSIQPEVIYSGQGAKSGNMSLKLDYLNIPMVAKLYVFKNLSLEAGPQLGFNIKSNLEFDGETQEVEDVNAIDFSGVFGLGYKLPEGIFIQARYVPGYMDVFEEVNGFQADIKNRVYQISVGYSF